MQRFTVAVGSDRLSFFTQEDGKNFTPVKINGVPFFKYERNSVSRDIGTVLSYIEDEYNLGSSDEIVVDLLENRDELTNIIVKKAFGNHVDKVFKISDIVNKAIDKLKSENEEIKKYGINYDGICYIIGEKGLKTDEFSLIAYTLDHEDILKYL